MNAISTQRRFPSPLAVLATRAAEFPEPQALRLTEHGIEERLPRLRAIRGRRAGHFVIARRGEKDKGG
jgi:hypothetical protein